MEVGSHMFREALSGILTALTTETNLQYHIVIAFSVLLTARQLNVTFTELIILVLVISMVISAELFNTSLERLCDKVQPQQDTLIRDIKDISAGAVLIIVIMSIVVGTVVFYPHISNTAKTSDELQIIDSVAYKITINGIPIKQLVWKSVEFVGGASPYPWDLWRSKGIIRYYFIEDLSSDRADNYRDTIIGISLLYPTNSEGNRDYLTGKIIGQPYVLNACIYVTVEGSSPKVVRYENKTIVDYDYIRDFGGVGLGYAYGLLYVEV
jgi:diacylglycerol kinase